jgi:hypothetical protein
LTSKQQSRIRKLRPKSNQLNKRTPLDEWCLDAPAHVQLDFGKAANCLRRFNKVSNLYFICLISF